MNKNSILYILNKLAKPYSHPLHILTKPLLSQPWGIVKSLIGSIIVLGLIGLGLALSPFVILALSAEALAASGIARAIGVGIVSTAFIGVVGGLLIAGIAVGLALTTVARLLVGTVGLITRPIATLVHGGFTHTRENVVVLPWQPQSSYTQAQTQMSSPVSRPNQIASTFGNLTTGANPTEAFTSLFQIARNARADIAYGQPVNSDALYDTSRPFPAHPTL